MIKIHRGDKINTEYGELTVICITEEWIIGSREVNNKEQEFEEFAVSTVMDSIWIEPEFVMDLPDKDADLELSVGRHAK